MRSLFLKIFLTFLIATEAISLSLLVFWTLQPETAIHRWRASTGEAVALYAQSAAEEMDRYGQTALGNYLQRLGSATRIRAGFLDESGNLLAGAVPKEAQQLIDNVRQDGEPEFDVRFASALAVQRAQGPSGRIYIFVAQMPRGPFGAYRRGWRGPVIYWAVAIPVAGLICYWLTWYITRPVLRLRTAARLMAEGDLSARAAPRMERRRDELGELVRDFNQMADRIESLVTSQRQLISDISHELRSPLARLSVALGLARQRAGEPAAGPLDRIEREADRLNEMIGKLLALARMEGAAGPPEKSRVNLRDLLAEVADDAEFEAQERGCTVRLTETQSGPAGVPGTVKSCAVMGSAELLRSAFDNVVRNALHYTAAGSQIDVKLSCVDGWASVQVRDHGPGVPENELGNVFRPFYRIANARDRQTGGTGLGLAITDRAVRLHGGSVHAENAEGGGLLVEIQLPIGNGSTPAVSENRQDSTPKPEASTKSQVTSND